MARRRRKPKQQLQKSEPVFDYESIVRDVARMQMATHKIPALVAEEIKKGWKQLPNTDASRSPKSWFHDPLALQYSLGYKDRRFSLTYSTLKRIAGQLSIISSIINTRAAQVAAFSQPYRWTKSLGFTIRHKDPDHATTPAELEFIKELERFILQCGRAEKNPWSRTPRDDFEAFLRKVVRDTLIYDQVCVIAGTLIEGEDGCQVPIEAVVCGDLVRTHTGQMKSVVELKHRSFTGKLVTIRAGGQEIKATDNHPFLAITNPWFWLPKLPNKKETKPKWVAAKDLNPDYYLVYPKHSIPSRSQEVSIQDGEFSYVKVSFASSTLVENLPVYNFEVEDDHSYVANGFVNHNCVEIVPDGVNLPFEFIAVDASTIRIASDNRFVGVNSSMHTRSGFVPSVPSRFASLYEGSQYGFPRTSKGNPVAYVQVINGQIENVYDDRELAFGVRNPRTDIYIQQYGYSELEQLITIVTSHLYAERYNQNFFSQGSTPKGILNLKGDNFTPEMLEGFRRQWLAQVSGVESSWKTPILQSEGLDWIDLAKTNRDMEFGSWLEYLIKIICGVYLVDPAEINFDLHGGQQNTPLFESSQEWKLKASRDRGLKPLLRFFAKLINTNIIDKIDDHFTFEFVGLDELSEQEKHEMLVEQISSYMTLNEARKSLDLPPLPGGDIPMNPVYIQAQQLAAEGGGGAIGGEGSTGSAIGEEGSSSSELPEGPSNMGSKKPSYTQNFQFSGAGTEGKTE